MKDHHPINTPHLGNHCMIIRESAKVHMSGHVTISAVKSDGTEREVSFRNLIVDSGIDYVVANSDVPDSTMPIKVARFGLGSTAPTNADVGLETPHGAYSSQGVVVSRKKHAADGTVIASGSVETPLAYTSTNWTFTFNSTTVPAGTLAEVGIFGEEETGERILWARALIKDDEGNPTTFTVDGDEILYVRYELRKYVPADVTGQIEIAGTTYDYTIRPFNVNSADWNADAPVFGPIIDTMNHVFDTGLLDIHETSHGIPPEGAEPGAMIAAPYVPGTGYRDVTVRWEALEGLIDTGIAKIGGIPYTPVGSVTPVTDVSSYQVAFNPAVVKDDRHRLSITLRYTLTRKA